LDLFAGSGALGIEALSRGAGSVDFIEMDREACALIRDNLAACGWAPSEGIRIIQRDALPWISAGGGSVGKAQGLAGAPGPAEGHTARRYDIILADPPHRKGFEEAALDLLSQGALLSPQGILVLESDARGLLPEKQGGLYLLKSKAYGGTKISYYLMGEDRV
jgi:16S rRNA G966 N2-methylase RsmD